MDAKSFKEQNATSNQKVAKSSKKIAMLAKIWDKMLSQR